MNHGALPDLLIFGTGSSSTHDFEFCKIAFFVNRLFTKTIWWSSSNNDPSSEHLLFMGTEKYPDENHFEEFIGRFGGYSNASTHESFTRYHVSPMFINDGASENVFSLK